MLDVFNNNAFSVVSLTDAINKLKYKPSRISAMGLFLASSVAQTSIALEEKNGILELIAPSARGGAGQTIGKERRTLRSISIPHFEINDAVYADEVQGVRAFGSETQLETVQGKVTEKLGTHNASHEVTTEYSRVGAIKGVVKYADGSELNLFDTFGVVQQGEIAFDLAAATPASGALRKKCAGVVRLISEILDGVPFDGVHAFVGSAFFDDLIAHPEVRDTYLGWAQAEELRRGYAYSAFPFGGIMWEEYRGKVGGTQFIEADKAHFFPTGAVGLFRTVYGPADYTEAVNTLGLERYAKQYPMQNGKGVHLDSQTNQVNYCTRPAALLVGRRQS